MTTMVMATRNPGKVRDLRHLFPGLALVELGPEVPEVDEIGASFEENAVLKARAAAAATGRPALGDDSGLEVDALDGAPGVRSARFATAAGTAAERDAANNAKLLAALAGVPPERRTARFRSVLAFADGDALIVAHGTCEGVILDRPRGTGGFGYDPLFFAPELGKTFAQADLAEKARVSHRGRAAAAIAPRLTAHFGIANPRASR